MLDAQASPGLVTPLSQNEAQFFLSIIIGSGHFVVMATQSLNSIVNLLVYIGSTPLYSPTLFMYTNSTNDFLNSAIIAGYILSRLYH